VDRPPRHGGAAAIVQRVVARRVRRSSTGSRTHAIYQHCCHQGLNGCPEGDAMSEGHKNQADQEEVPLSKAVEYLLEECRMVLPGLQALFGFQLIAVFNSGFKESLNPAEQRYHLLATALVAISAALIMTPAAYHRQIGAHKISEAFCKLSTRLLLWSMWPLAIAIAIEVYLISRIIVNGVLVPLIPAAVFAVFMLLWFALPRSTALQKLLAGRSE
jgi:hypothetical protein